MGRINTRVRALSEAFQDGDLFVPPHDKIMLWLNDWVKNPENLRRFIAKAHPDRREMTVSILEDISAENIQLREDGKLDEAKAWIWTTSSAITRITIPSIVRVSSPMRRSARSN